MIKISKLFKNRLFFANLLYQLKHNPENFKLDFGNYNLVNESMEYRVWIASGFWFYKISRTRGKDNKVPFTLLEKIQFAYAFHAMRKAERKKEKIEIMQEINKALGVNENADKT